MIFKILFDIKNDKIKTIFKWFQFYHPSLKRLKELSEGESETLLDRSVEFSTLLNDLWVDGVGKRTGLGRLVVLDEWITSFIPRNNLKPLSILDVGGSDGSTTFELVKYLENILGSKILASILEKQLRLHCFKRGCLKYYLTNEHKPFMLQIGLLGILFEESKLKSGFIFNPIVKFAEKYLQKICLERYLKREEDLLLINPLIREFPDVTWIEQDLFQYNKSLVGTFDLIRCCNLLNISYFSKEQILNAIRLLSIYLKPNGLLLVSRSLKDFHGSELTASIWMKSSTGLMHISDLNGGSEIKNIIEL
jgi:hypothetical protein